MIGIREKRGSTPLRLLHADTRTARRETAPVTSSPLSLALVLQSASIQPASIPSPGTSVQTPACVHVSARIFDPCASRAIVTPAAPSSWAVDAGPASRWSGWGCHQSVPSRTQRHLRVRPPRPRRIQVRCRLSSQPPMLPRARASRALHAPRLRCGALSAPPLSDHRSSRGTGDTAARGTSLCRASRPVFGCGSRRDSAPSFSPSLRCVSSRALRQPSTSCIQAALSRPLPGGSRSGCFVPPAPLRVWPCMCVAPRSWVQREPLPPRRPAIRCACAAAASSARALSHWSTASARVELGPPGPRASSALPAALPALGLRSAGSWRCFSSCDCNCLEQ